MDFNEYQNLSSRTTQNTGTDLHMDLIEAAMGVVGEAAEILEHLKKAIFQGHTLDVEKLIEESGDTLWYLSELSRRLNVPFERVASHNVAKLYARYPDGFSAERSVNRKE